MSKKIFSLRRISNHCCLLLFLPIGFCSFGQANTTLQLLTKNSHYFFYKSKPLIIIGSGEHYGAVMNTEFNYDIYLETLKKDGLNNTRLFMGAYYEKPGAFGIERNTLAPKDPLLPWRKDNDKFDLTKWNETYFTRLHDFMKKALQHDIIVEINLFSSYYGAGWSYHPFHGNNNINNTATDLPSNKVNTLENGALLKFQEAYVRKLVRELNQYDNFYFEIQNEPWADQKDTIIVWNDFLGKEDLAQQWNNWKNTIEIPSENSLKWHRTVTSWIRDEEKNLPKVHLISHNVANFKLPVFVTDPDISIYTFHYAFPDAVTVNHSLFKPIGFNETGFAGRSDDTYRRQAWRFIMSGGALFDHLDYSFTVGKEDGTDTANKAPGGGSPALRRSFGYLKKYFDGLDLITLKPDKSFLNHAEGAFVYTMRDERNRIIYIEPVSAKPVTLQIKLPFGKYDVEWMDVKTGKPIKTEKIQVRSVKTELKSPPGSGDTVVKVKLSQ